MRFVSRLFLLCIAALAAFASDTPTPNSVIISQVNAAVDNSVTYYIDELSGNADGALMWNGTAKRQQVWTLAATRTAIGAFAQPTGTTAQYIRGDGSLATFPTVATPIPHNNVSHSLNSNFTIATVDANVSYSLGVAWTLNALLSGSGDAYLEQSTDSGTTWVTITEAHKAIGLLTFAGNDSMTLTGWVKASALTRIRTTSSNMTVSYARGQEYY